MHPDFKAIEQHIVRARAQRSAYLGILIAEALLAVNAFLLSLPRRLGALRPSGRHAVKRVAMPASRS